MKRVAIDADGVIYDFNNPFHELLSIHCDTMIPFPHDGPQVWNWFERYGASKDAIAAAWEDATPEWWGNLPPHDDATEDALNHLIDLSDEADVTYVSARPQGRDETVAAIGRMTYITNPQVVLAPLSRKTPILIGMAPHVVIEDSGSNLAEYAAAERDYSLPPCTKILIARPYNRQWQSSPGLHVVSSTENALRLARKVVNEV